MVKTSWSEDGGGSRKSTKSFSSCFLRIFLESRKTKHREDEGARNRNYHAFQGSPAATSSCPRQIDSLYDSSGGGKELIGFWFFTIITTQIHAHTIWAGRLDAY